MRVLRDHSTRLGIAWIHSRLEIAVVRSQREPQVWVAQDPVRDVEALAEALSQGLRVLGPIDAPATLIFEQRNLVFHLQETPPARGRRLDQILDRLVDEQHFFAGPTAVTRAPTPPVGGKDRWLLAVAPQPFILELIQACAASRLSLAGIFPITTLAAGQRPRSNDLHPSPELVVTQLGESHQLVIARGPEEIWFARSLPKVEGPDGTRLEQEIHRTLLFAKQRFGTEVRRVVWQRDSRQDPPPSRPSSSDPAIQYLGDADPALNFAVAAARLDPGAPFNFAKIPAAETVTDRRSATLLATLALVLAIGFAAAVEFYRNRALDQADRITRERHAEAEVASIRLARQRDADQLMRFLRTVRGDATNSTPVAFLRRLAFTTPASLRLSRVSTTLATNGWNFTIEGATRVQGSPYLGIVEEFEKRLEQDSPPCLVLASTARQTLSGSSATVPFPSSAFPRYQGMPPRADERPWFVSGVLR